MKKYSYGLNIELLLIMLAMVFAVAVDTMAQDDKEMGETGRDRYFLEESEIAKLVIKALDGSGGAAKRLHLHYEFTTPNDARSKYWATIGAENGDVLCQHNLAISMIEESTDPDTKRRGIYWLKKAANNGSKISKEVLNRLVSVRE